MNEFKAKDKNTAAATWRREGHLETEQLQGCCVKVSEFPDFCLQPEKILNILSGQT